MQTSVLNALGITVSKLSTFAITSPPEQFKISSGGFYDIQKKTSSYLHRLDEEKNNK